MTEHDLEWSDLISLVQAIGNIAALARLALSKLCPARSDPALKRARLEIHPTASEP
jgi:hypothetical protein